MASFKLEAIADVHKFADEESCIRFLGPVSSFCQVWFKVKGSNERCYPIQKLCLDWDPEENSFVRNICPYRKAGLKCQVNHISNGIVRSLQSKPPEILRPHTKYERKPRRESGSTVYWKQRKSKSWTPVRLMRITKSVAARINDMCVERNHNVEH